MLLTSSEVYPAGGEISKRAMQSLVIACESASLPNGDILHHCLQTCCSNFAILGVFRHTAAGSECTLSFITFEYTFGVEEHLVGSVKL